MNGRAKLFRGPGNVRATGLNANDWRRAVLTYGYGYPKSVSRTLYLSFIMHAAPWESHARAEFAAFRTLLAGHNIFRLSGPRLARQRARYVVGPNNGENTATRRVCGMRMLPLLAGQASFDLWNRPALVNLQQLFIELDEECRWKTRALYRGRVPG